MPDDKQSPPEVAQEPAPGAPPPPEVARLNPQQEPAPPGSEPAPEPAPGLTLEEARAFARAGVDWVGDALVAQFPALVAPPAVGLADPDVRERVAELAGAVIAKRGLPAFLARWREEFMLGAFLAGVAWSSYQRIRRGAPSGPSDSHPQS
jgi:hypothetical protein